MPKDWHTLHAPPIVALSAVAFSFSLAASAVATQTLSTEVISSGATPVRIDSCRAAMVDKAGHGGLIVAALTTQRNYYVEAAVDFTNISGYPVDAVRFVFDVHDTFNATTESLGLDWLGTFAPGVAIHARRNLAGTVGAVQQENTASTPTTVICRVQFVRFGDGRIWKEGDRSAPVAPGLVYPTPYPTGSP